MPIQKKWEIAPLIPADVDESLKEYPPILRQLLFNRNITDAARANRYLGKIQYIYDPYQLNSMNVAVDRLLSAIDQHKKIVVYGDYDVDGVASCALMVSLIRGYGGDVRHYIPDRFEEGYGLNKEAIISLGKSGVDLILTVDCGIRSPEEVSLALELGIQVIISDHHEPDKNLPDEAAVISPRMIGSEYPEKNLAGVGLAYKIAQATMKERTLPHLIVEDFLDLVAIGTVADLVPLTGENRTLVRDGLEHIRHKPRQGVFSLARACGLTIEAITARNIGFILGPRLNAAGRLETAQESYQLLMATDVLEAGERAQKLDDFNKERQKQTRELVEKALSQIAEDDGANLHFAMMDDGINSETDSKSKIGILGLVASRVTESYYRPSIIACNDKDVVRASCRSIPEFHITKALDKCADLLIKHGGHAMAAGFTVNKECLPELKARMLKIAANELQTIDLNPVIHIDLEIALKDLRPEILNQQDQLEPTGMDNPEAIYVSRNLKIRHSKMVGSEKNHLRMTLSDGTITYDAIAFNLAYMIDTLPDYVDVVYKFERNNFQDRTTLQLNILDMKPACSG